MQIPHVTVAPGKVILAHASDLVDCLVDGFSEIETNETPVRVIYGNYAALAVLRISTADIENNALWGAKLVETPEAPDHTFVLVGEVVKLSPLDWQGLSKLVVHVSMIFS